MKHSSLVALLAVSSIACSAKGTSPTPAVDAASPDVVATDVVATDVSSPDVSSPDVMATDVTQPDAPSADVTADAPSDAAPTRCARDLDCSGVTFCSPDGVCVPLVCTPGRLMCVSPARAQVCDGRGATFTEMDCPGGCVLNNCMGAMTTCPSPRVTCGTACTDVQTSVTHCGRCGNACAAGQSCVAGACTTPCAAPRLLCGGACTDVQTSVTHCGRCGNACASGQSCVAGVCTAPCVAPSVVCGAACVDLRTSNGHCGRCDNLCPGGQTCLGAMCTTVCAAPRVMCGSACVDLRTDTSNCGRCGGACGASQSCTAGVCTAVTTSGFRVLSLTTTGCQTVEHNAETGDDRGGIALAGDRLFYNADTHFGRWQANDLSGFASLAGPHDGMVSDLATNTVYAAVNALGQEFPGSTATSLTGFTITHLVALDPTTAALTSTRIALTMPLVVTHDVGFFSGHGFVLVYTGVASDPFYPRWSRIDLATGLTITYASTGTVPHHICENGGWYGVAERQGAEYYAVAVRNNMSIARTHIPDNVQTVVGTFTDIADICSITVSPSRNRWYFHFEGSSEIAPMGVETTGYCAATFALTP